MEKLLRTPPSEHENQRSVWLLNHCDLISPLLEENIDKKRKIDEIITVMEEQIIEHLQLPSLFVEKARLTGQYGEHIYRREYKTFVARVNCPATRMAYHAINLDWIRFAPISCLLQSSRLYVLAENSDTALAYAIDRRAIIKEYLSVDILTDEPFRTSQLSPFTL